MLVEWLREEMRARGLLQKELGALAGWDEYTTSKVMRGVRDISASEFVALMKAFGYPVPTAIDPRLNDIQKIVRLAAKMSPEARQALADYLDRVSRT